MARRRWIPASAGMTDRDNKVKNPSRLRMAMAVSEVGSMALLGKGQMVFFREHGFAVDCLAAKDNLLDVILAEGVDFFDIPFVRDLSPLADIKCLWQLVRLFRKRRPDVIQLMTLKPSILGAIAGRLTGVPVIIRHKWGSMLDCNYHGLNRFLLFRADRISNRLAHRVVAVSHQLFDSEVRIGAIDPQKALVYGGGSASGLDLDCFKLTEDRKKQGQKIRQQWNMSASDFVIGTVMRVNVEKGICELVKAFVKLYEKMPNLRLMIVGKYNIRGLPPENIVRTIAEHPGIRHLGFQREIPPCYAAMDVFVLPTYREGFCNSNLEASGMALPVISTDVIGCGGSSVLDGVTGLVVPVRNVPALIAAIEKIITEPELARKLGKQGRERVEKEFDQKLVWHNQLRDVCELLKQKGITAPVDPAAIVGKTCPLCNG